MAIKVLQIKTALGVYLTPVRTAMVKAEGDKATTTDVGEGMVKEKPLSTSGATINCEHTEVITPQRCTYIHGYNFTIQTAKKWTQPRRSCNHDYAGISGLCFIGK